MRGMLCVVSNGEILERWLIFNLERRR